MVNAIYIHIPFCLKKCYYCDFFSFIPKTNDIENYLEYVIKEIKLYDENIYDTVYFGGGTPSMLNSVQIKKILSKINFNKNSEITLEINPATVNYEELVNYKKAGINRLSIGCQSFDDKILKIIGRNHDSEDALKVYKDARKAGFENISIDFIFGIPGQDMKSIENDIKIIKEISPEHISIYSLIWKENTKFWEMLQNNEIKEIDEDIEADMYEKIISNLKKIGYIHYEISTFSKPGYYSKHNLKYWRNENYIGIGMGAAGYINDIRYKNYCNKEKYYSKIDNGEKPYEDKEYIDNNKKDEYYYILGLRMLEEGVEISKEYEKIAEKLIVGNFLKKKKNGKYVLTKKGIFLANEVFMEFIR